MVLMKRLEYEQLQMEVVVFETDDVMETSGEGNETTASVPVTLPLIPLP